MNERNTPSTIITETYITKRKQNKSSDNSKTIKRWIAVSIQLAHAR